MKTTKRIFAVLIIMLFGVLPVQASEGFQPGNDKTAELSETNVTGKNSDIGLLGYIGNVTQGDRKVDIDGDGTVDYIVPRNDFISVNVTLKTTAIATMKADNTVDFRCGTIAVLNENENRPVKVEIQEVSMEAAGSIKLVSWDKINSNNADTADEIALKVKPVREKDFPVTDVSDIGKTGGSAMLTVSDSLKGAIGYTLDGNYTENLLNSHQDGILPKISFVYKISKVS